MTEKYLPIGSIVKIKDCDKTIMIMGYYSLEFEQNLKIYDYIGCTYPEGMLVKNNTILFDHKEIVEVIYNGYVNNEYEILNNKLLNKVEEKVSTEEIKLDEVNEIIYDDINDVTENENRDLKDDNYTYQFGDDGAFVLDNLASDNEEFKIPHYEFDENGIIINN